MKFEYGIIIFVGGLVFSILGLIISAPTEIPSIRQLEHINQQAILAKDAENQDKVEELRIQIQEQLQKITTPQLGVKISKVDVELGFPFRNASEIEPFDNESFAGPICNIIPHIPTQLKIIKNSEMFSMFSKKYQNYPLELLIQDERKYQSTVHYSFVAKSNNENSTASMWAHLNSCSDEMPIVYNLRCRDMTTNKAKHTFTLSEITDSINDDEFCKITFPDWKQKLYDYGQTISDKMAIHREKLPDIEKDPTFEKVMAFQNEMSRLGLLGNIAGKAALNGLDDKEVQDMKEEYRMKFGEIPKDLLALIEK